MNYWLAPLAFFVGGMTLKWVLDLFFLRQGSQETERMLSVREAEFTALKHEHSQKLIELKNKLMELDATSKAKAVAEGNLSKQNSDLVALRAHILRTEEDLATSRNNEVALLERIATRDAELQVAIGRIDSLELENRDQVSAVESLRLRLEEVASVASTHGGTVVELRTTLATLHQEAAEASVRRVALSGELDAQRSVTTTLEEAVRSRDVQIADGLSRYAALEAERQSVATSLGVADRELAFARSELTERSLELKEAKQFAAIQKQELQSLRQQLDAAVQTRLAAEALAKRQVVEIDRAERQAHESRQGAEAIAIEHQRLMTELATVRQEAVIAGEQHAELRARLRTAEDESAGHLLRLAELQVRINRIESERVERPSQTDLARVEVPQLDVQSDAPPVPDLADRLRNVEAELEAVSASHAQLETELARERQSAAGLHEQLREVTESLARNPMSNPVSPSLVPPGDAALLAEIDELNRERNTLAAELAALKSAQPPAPTPARRKKGRPAEVDLFGVTPEVPAEPPPVLTPVDGPAPTEAILEFASRCPQHLSDVKGIGTVFESRLYAAGVGSYWELSQLSDRTLAEILELDAPLREQFDFAATRTDAARLAAETRSVGRKWTGEQPDDLEPLEGIGPAIEKRLYDAGICTFQALAAATEEHLAELCPSAKFRGANYVHWIEQARQRIASEEN